MPRVALLLTNPGARKASDGAPDAFDLLRANELEVIAESIEHPTQIGELVRRHASVIDRVVVGGGDGTIGAATAPVLAHGFPLGILPLGTANNVARTLGIPTELEAACAVAAGSHERRIDVGEVNGHCFLTTASLGLSVAITEELSSESKRRWGALAYAAAAARVVARAHPVRARIRWDGGHLLTRTVQLVVGNGRYYGSALQVSEDAEIDDCALDLYSIELRHWWQLVPLAYALKRGRHGRRRAVRTARARWFEIETPRPLPIDADGELATHTPARVVVRPGALRVLAPVDDDAAS